MKDFEIKSNGKNGILLFTKCPVTNKDVISFSLIAKSDVLELQRQINEFVENNLKTTEYRAVLHKGATDIESIWVEDIHEAVEMGERGIEFYNASHYTIEDREI